jgi:glycosyltransferase involved in cell wall biosynthesis
MNRDIVRDGVNGFWTTTKREWVDRLGLLIEDPELRKQMGLAGRKIVEERYSLQVVGERLIELFKEL